MSLHPTLAQWMTNHLPGSRFLLASLGTASAATALSSHFIYTAGLVTLGGSLLHLRRTHRQAASQHRQELALRKELLAYLLFNGSPHTMEAADLGRQVSRLIAVRSSFGRAAFLLRDATGTLTVTGSAGFDDLSVEALNRWGASVSDPELPLSRIVHGKHRVAVSSFTLPLDRRATERSPLSSMSCPDVHVVPLRTAHGLLGALVVCTKPRSVSKSAEDLDLSWLLGPTVSLPLADLLQPLEAFALRLTMQLAAPANLTNACPPRSVSRPAVHPDRPSCADRNPDRASDRHGRRARTRNHPPQPGGSNVHPFRSHAHPVSSILATAAPLNHCQQALQPAYLHQQRVAGVSGRPPAHLWHTRGAVAAI